MPVVSARPVTLSVASPDGDGDAEGAPATAVLGPVPAVVDDGDAAVEPDGLGRAVDPVGTAADRDGTATEPFGAGVLTRGAAVAVVVRAVGLGVALVVGFGAPGGRTLGGRPPLKAQPSTDPARGR